MDINGDGQQDVITGHYWPGDIYVFYGKGNGKFSKMNNLKDQTGRNLNAGEPWEADDTPRPQSLAATPYAADLDRDGDYDLLIGNSEGSVVFMENVGDAKKPIFSTKRKKLKAAGKEIRVPIGDAAPVYEDWNRDGLADLIIGAGDGSVWFYENTGQKDAPMFVAGTMLVPAGTWAPYPHSTEPIRPGARSKVCVTDYNGDGLVDLLLGDVCYEIAAPRTLDATAKRGQEDEPPTTHGFVWLFLRIRQLTNDRDSR